MFQSPQATQLPEEKYASRKAEVRNNVQHRIWIILMRDTFHAYIVKWRLNLYRCEFAHTYLSKNSLYSCIKETNNRRLYRSLYYERLTAASYLYVCDTFG